MAAQGADVPRGSGVGWLPAAEVAAIAFERAKDLAQLDSKIHAQIKRDMRRQEIGAMRQAVEDGKRGFPG